MVKKIRKVEKFLLENKFIKLVYMKEKIKKFIKENWFNIVLLLIVTILTIVVIYSEREMAALNKWSKLCSKVSITELQVRKALDIKMGDKEIEWCRNTFYSFFK